MIHILGIRHHGPGSARNVRHFLEEVRPDIVLVEGPPEADSILKWVGGKNLIPPVAILCYQPDKPKQSSFFPFAEFSPEWQAISYARKNNIHVRFMDLPMVHQLAFDEEDAAKETVDENHINDEKHEEPNNQLIESNTQKIKRDPISYLAEIAGYSDAEKWWEMMFEHRVNNEEVFTAVNEAMLALRENLADKDDRKEQLREAHMRKTIRQAEKEMFQNIAVICGAWHAPALQNMPKQKEDNELLKGLPKVKVDCTWIPWTYNRLSFYSGYGAGITSPGWYNHVWNYPKDDGTRWLATVAKLFREKQMDTSSAHIIEAVRLANMLAALRGMNKAGLEEMNEATITVLCNGEPIMLSLVNNELIVSNRIGEVPIDIPKPPLQADIEKSQKKLRLPATADWKDYILDLRKETDLERSVLLHRLLLLDINWGEKNFVTGKGTFKEQWRLQWDPELSVNIIEKGTWGNTVKEAAFQYVSHTVKSLKSLPEVCKLLDSTIPAELPLAVDAIIYQINNLAATGNDVVQLMESLPSLVHISRYGNVRKTDAKLVADIAENMALRIFISLPPACTGIDENAANTLLELFTKLNEAIGLLQNDSISLEWQKALHTIAASKNTAPVIAGYSTRLLADHKQMRDKELYKAFFFAMSQATAPAVSASWLEGFLRGSGTILLIDEVLWNVVNNWVDSLEKDVFIQVLPLLRRTFSLFSKPELRKIGEKVKSGGTTTTSKDLSIGFDETRAIKGIDIMMTLFGYNTQTTI